ncbi:FadR family transcriptional regulator [Corynebacterium sp. 13CS0277]|uniref:FadR/GntR family transcriptional regulator n=1 Tax=Corynebacterium sp. 13CS0277 TaxID=2071994 RepID=UPI000D02291B|nr:FCD domain-containing protein [Corynebacterium sp. 13CS0277]PRQ12604.1 FadR family transcriptional regulator [Corynebacterium sp. 13CS0277]
MTTKHPRHQPPKTRTEQVRDDIMAYIISHGLSAGDAIPTEAQLVTITGASRSSVREALKVMETMGIVSIRRGHGTFVAETSMDALTAQLSFGVKRDLPNGPTVLLETVELREILEQGLARQLCLTPHLDVTAAKEALALMSEDAETTGDIDAAHDRLFHTSLYAPLGNSLVTPLLGSFFDVYQQVELGPAGSAPATESVRRHQDILAAIEARDAEAAAFAVTRHFDIIRRRLAHFVPQNHAL